MRQEYVVEILPDGRAALRIAIVPPEKDTRPLPGSEDEADRGVVILPLYEEPREESGRVIEWQM